MGMVSANQSMVAWDIDVTLQAPFNGLLYMFGCMNDGKQVVPSEINKSNAVIMLCFIDDTCYCSARAQMEFCSHLKKKKKRVV